VKSDEPDIAIGLGLTNVRLHVFSCWVHASLFLQFVGLKCYLNLWRSSNVTC